MSRTDSLNGIPGHQFGEPLSAFPGLVLAKSQQPGSQTYRYPDEKPEAGWFGKHKKDVPSVFYVFRNGKFSMFQAVGYGTGRQALEQEAQYLLGPGQQHTEHTSWSGKKAQAFYSPQTLTRGPAAVLTIESLEGAAAQAAAEANRLKQENAVQ
ncbi:MAG: hypothetical protein ACRYGH_22760 [Janthinobacterium lividum]